MIKRLRIFEYQTMPSLADCLGVTKQALHHQIKAGRPCQGYEIEGRPAPDDEGLPSATEMLWRAVRPQGVKS